MLWCLNGGGSKSLQYTIVYYTGIYVEPAPAPVLPSLSAAAAACFAAPPPPVPYGGGGQ